jgi:hypothetical protein
MPTGNKRGLAVIRMPHITNTVKVLREEEEVHYILGGCSLDCRIGWERVYDVDEFM